MYYIETNKKIKNLFLIIFLFLCVLFPLKGCYDKENYNKERNVYKENIKTLEKKYDSLENYSKNLSLETEKLQEKYIKDSTIVDSISHVYNIQLYKTKQVQNQANYYYTKYSELNNQILILENNQNYKNGDDLLKSLGSKLK